MKTNIFLASSAFVLGLLALFANYSEKTGMYPTWEFRKEINENRKIKLISAIKLSEWIMQKRKGLVIIDMRSEDEYIKYHIPTAQLYNDSIFSPEIVSGNNIVLYSFENYTYLNKFQNELLDNVYHLEGGLEIWFEKILFPDFNKFKVRNKELMNKIISTSRYFGGNPLNIDEIKITDKNKWFRDGC